MHHVLSACCLNRDVRPQSHQQCVGVEVAFLSIHFLSMHVNRLKLKHSYKECLCVSTTGVQPRCNTSLRLLCVCPIF